VNALSFKLKEALLHVDWAQVMLDLLRRIDSQHVLIMSKLGER